MTISRRSFLKSSAATTALSLAGGVVASAAGKAVSSAVQPGPGNKWPGRVVLNFNKNAITLPVTVNIDTVRKMVDDSVLLLTGQDSVGEAWKAIFPATLSAASTVAIKVPLGCSNANMAPHWSSVKAIVDGLTQMDFDGSKFPAGNITIYEMQCSDNFTRFGYTAANLPGVKILRDSLTTDATDGAFGLQYASTLQSDFLINVFRAGGHSTDFGGFTLGFKNHFGTYEPVHGDEGSTYLRDINCTGVVFNKNVLSVCVGLFGAREVGDPGDSAISYLNYAKTMDATLTGAVSSTTIILSTDPVSAEMQTIKMMRLNNGKSYTTDDMPAYLKASGGVSGGLSDQTYNIGIIDETAMDIRRIINGQIITTGTDRNRSNSAFIREKIRVTHLPASGVAFIEYHWPRALSVAAARIEIFDMAGTLVHAATLPVSGSVGQYSWDEKVRGGSIVPNGAYLVRIRAGANSITGKLSITR